MQRWWAQRMRASATPSTVRALMDMNSLVDVRDDAARGPGADPRAAPTRRRPLPATRRASTSPTGCRGRGSCCSTGEDHFVSGDPDQILDAVEPFVAAMQEPEHRRWPWPRWCRSPGRREGGRRRPGARGRAGTDGRPGHPVVLFDGPATGGPRGPRRTVGRTPASVSRWPRWSATPRSCGRTASRWPWTSPTRCRSARCGCRAPSACCSPGRASPSSRPAPPSWAASEHQVLRPV